ncbi:FAS1 domain-containing protein [Wolfiporia cocos MD-104 SS10]|uniref:FAS1 domain-containing protein n=1 Tax=Wolfiporia cocos (strain MD-104) TaxID=742152 RepID=A0A2H3IVJ7_WOLCO|nr:FAS1 domain-containing protein [Wolfiporia cocos MD-104 SS10]
MRLWTSAALLALLPLAAPAQIPLQRPHTQSTTLLDALSADPDYVSLIKLLQKAKLIPTLNRLNGSTLFAPTNDAIAKHAFWQAALTDDLRDNIQEELRQQLFYHLLNYTLLPLPTEVAPQEHETLLYPRTPVEPPTHEPPPGPPWMPVPGGTLGGAPQRLRAAYRDDSVWAGVDAFGKQGVEVVKEEVDTVNGVLLGIGSVLDMPPDLATVVSRHPSLSYLSNVLTPEMIQFLNTSSALTLFLPVDKAWEALPYYERLYLQSKFATDDLTRIVHMHAVSQKHVKYSDAFAAPLNLTTLDGSRLEIRADDSGRVKVSTAELAEADIYASNGVVHTVSDMLIPPGALQLTPEKYLLTLDCTTFVDLLHSVDLASLVNDTHTEWTILAPRDDVITLFGDDSELPERGSDEMRRLLRYHFIPGKWAPKKLSNGMLLETALEEPGLGGGRQVMSVEVNGEDSLKGDDGKSKSVRFAGAGTIGDHVEINNTLIYFISRPLTPPADALQTALPELELSTYLAAVFSTNLADLLKTTPRTTLLIPPNSAFKRLGMLVSAHLLAASSKADLERVIEHHALVDVEYAGALVNGSQRTFGTLEGSDVHADRRANGSVLISASGGWAGMRALLAPRDMLTQTGVIHEVSDIMIPRSVDLTIGKLVKAAKATTMATMMTKAGFDWILNGTAPPPDSPWAEQGLSGSGWTLLCPTDDAFKEINLTTLYADTDKLQAIVAQHLIPAQMPRNDVIEDVLYNNRPLAMNDGAAYRTLQTVSAQSTYGDVVFLEDAGEASVIMVGVRDARGQNGRSDWARVLLWGRSTTGGGTGGVVQIDRMLMPYEPSWLIANSAPIAGGVVGILVIGAFFYLVRYVWRRDTTEATYEPIGGFGQDDGEES